MGETFFDELKRYVELGPRDEELLRRVGPRLGPFFGEVIDAFYDRLIRHQEARRVLDGEAQIDRLKDLLRGWLESLFSGPWDEAYYERRARIGRVHFAIALPQRYMFGGMNQIRLVLVRLIGTLLHDQPDERAETELAMHKIVDVELAIMLETYRDEFVQKVQYVERLERLSLHEQLASTEARYQQIVEKAEALITTMDREGRVLLVNARCEQATGAARWEVIGRPWIEVFAEEADREEAAERLREVLAGGAAPLFEAPVPRPAAPGRLRRVRWHFTTLPAVSGQVLCGIGLDVTEEHELGIRTRLAERLAALGTMAAGLAHEIRNPINAAHLQLNLARRRLARSGGDPSVVQAVELADGEMIRLAGLVEDFLRFARPHTLRIAAGDLRAVAEATVALVGPEAQALGIAVALAPGRPVEAEFDDEKMKQVLLNLVRNALQASIASGRVAIEVEQRSGVARLSVSDEGRGIPPDAPIFEPFFTTKDTGTGLGLSIVHRIVSDHGGAIEVTSQPGHTVFTVSIPIARGSSPLARRVL